MMLIVDNCEHLLVPVAELVAAIAAACDTVAILTTGREPLGLQGERVMSIPSMTIPDGVALFVARAEATDDSVRFDAQDRVVLGTICARLPGSAPDHGVQCRLLARADRLERQRGRKLTPVACSYRLVKTSVVPPAIAIHSSSVMVDRA